MGALKQFFGGPLDGAWIDSNYVIEGSICLPLRISRYTHTMSQWEVTDQNHAELRALYKFTRSGELAYAGRC